MSQKIRAIYDALDHGNYKGVLKLCAAFLQKQAGHALCKALHAVALERLGRRDEALQLCQEVCIAASGIDDTVLSTLQVVYRRCRQGPMIVQMYEEAWTREPDNEEFAVAFFLAMVREGDLAKGQQVAMKLHRKFNKPKYLHWIIVSILLQSQGGGAPKVLDLAEMMLAKAPLSTELLKTGEEGVPLNRTQLYLLQLHLTTLRLNGKHGQALEVLETFKGFVKLPGDVAGMRVRLLVEGGRVPEAAKEARARVLASGGDWGAVQDYVQLAFKSPVPGDPLPQLSVELAGAGAVAIPDHGARLRPKDGGVVPEVASMEDVESRSTEDEAWNALLLFRHLQQREAATAAAAAAARMGRLAELELRCAAFRLNEAALAESRSLGPDDWKAAVVPGDLKDFVCAVEAYLGLYSQRTSCYFELKPFLCLLGPGDAAPLLQLIACKEGSVHEASPTEMRLQRAFQRLQDGTSPEGMLERVRSLLRSWSGQDGSKSEVHHESLALAIAILVDLDRKGCGNYLVDAIALAEAGLAANPHAFPLKIILVLLYGALGAVGAMLRVYNHMDIKNILHESQSYLVSDALCCSGSYEGLHDLCCKVTEFHEDADKDGGDALGMAFHTGVLHRIPEYLQYLEKMGRSVVWGRAVVEEVLCDLGQAQTWDSVSDVLGKQSVLVSTVAVRPLDSWSTGSQQRSVLSSLHPLPLCSPLGIAHHASSASRTTLLQGARSPAVSSSALTWSWVALDPGDGKSAVPTPVCQGEMSALEELIRPPANAPAQLKLLASVLVALSALLRREGPDEGRLAEVLAGAREGLEAEGAAKEWAGGDPVAAIEGLAACDATAGRAPPWSPVPARFAALARRCAFSACEMAQVLLRCTSAKEPWEQAEARLATLTGMVKALVCQVRGGGGGDAGAAAVAAFAVGGRGVPCLWALLHSCTGVLIPVALWCSTALPKAGSGKKAKEGQEALQKTRAGLKNLIAVLQSGLAELQEILTGVQGADGGALLSTPAGTEGSMGSLLVTADDLPDFAKHREHARQAVLEAHRKHLQALREAVGARLALLKSRGAFKP